MQRIKNSHEAFLIQRLKTNCFSRKRNPSPIKLFTLTKALVKVNNHLLAKEMAYVLSTTLSYRLMMKDVYMLAYNTLVLNNWDEIVVIQLSNNIKKFNDVVCIDLQEYTHEFRCKHPVFIKLLLSELNTIRKN